MVLENDDVSWSVHDLLPICEELNIPFVLDFHHHNIIFDSDKIREGTKDIIDLFPRILATWKRKNKTPKMHYSEPTPSAITGRQRRKHSPRVAMLPPCPPNMDLMIEAKDKEQAVFELMRIFKLPGFATFSDITPYIRNDENKPAKAPKKKTPKKKDPNEEEAEEEEVKPTIIAEDEIAMGGPDGRVYWPPTMEEWLRPPKRVVKPKGPGAPGSAKKPKSEPKATNGENEAVAEEKKPSTKAKATPRKPTPEKAAIKALTPTPSLTSEGDVSSPPLSDLSGPSPPPPKKRKTAAAATKSVPSRPSRRAGTKVTYAEDGSE